MQASTFIKINVTYDDDQIRQTIAADFPALRVERLKLLSGGWSNYTYQVNDDLLFKFPKNNAANLCIEREMALLSYLGEYFKTLPRAEFVGRVPGDHAWTYFGYRMLPGVFLSDFYSENLSRETRTAILKQLAEFLSTLHQVPIEPAIASGVEALSFQEVSTKNLRAIRTLLPDRLPLAQLSWLIDLFTEYLTDEDNFRFGSVVLHGDLRPDHFLFDAEKKQLIRVIDFGGAIIGDRDYDLMYFLDTYGTPFIMELLEHHPHPNPTKLIRKLRFFLVWETTHLILHGINHQREHDVQRGLRALETYYQGNVRG